MILEQLMVINIKIKTIEIISEHITGIWDLPVNTPCNIIVSTSPQRRWYLIHALEVALCGLPEKNFPVPFEVIMVTLSNGTTFTFYNADKNQQNNFISHIEFKHHVLGSGFPLDIVNTYDFQQFDKIRRITGLKLFEINGVILSEINGQKYPIEVLPEKDIEFIILMLRFYELNVGIIPFIIITREQLSTLTDEARTAIFMKILELPVTCQCLFFAILSTPWECHLISCEALL